MRYAYLIIIALIAVGCATNKQIETTAPVAPPLNENTNHSPSSDFNFAWNGNPNGAQWTVYLNDAMKSFPEKGSIVTPCNKLKLKPCASQLLSIIAKRESNFKPETTYNETGHLQGVVSRGLFQISKDSANQTAYGCNITDAKQLHDPHVNIKCAVKILAYQAAKTGTLIDGAKGGCGAYWSVCRSKDGKSESYKAIINYMSKF